jgi:erythromycin esterase-like protein
MFWVIRLWLAVALLAAPAAHAALPGVSELHGAPEALTDAQLTALLGDAPARAGVIAIGETVHGSSMMLRMQTRLIRYLVTHHGLRLLAWETSVLRGERFARWLAACRDTVSPAPLDELYFPTASDAPLWEWACRFNREHPDNPLVFGGVDVWDRPWEHHARLRETLGKADLAPREVAMVEQQCSTARAQTWADVDALVIAPSVALSRCREALSTLMDSARRRGLFDAALSASTLLGWLGFYEHQGRDDMASWAERDQAQARNLLFLKDKFKSARAVLAAHTSHLAHGRSAADWWGSGDLKSGVHFYQKLTGKPVYAIALTAYTASGAQGEWSLPVARNSIDKRLHDAGHRMAFFNASAPFLKEHARWWMQNQNAPPHENGVDLVPRDHFDAWFFFSESRLDRALPARPLWQP